MPLYHHEDEFRALTGDRLRRTLKEVQAQAVAFGDL
jgi:hypothetical protein